MIYNVLSIYFDTFILLKKFKDLVLNIFNMFKLNLLQLIMIITNKHTKYAKKLNIKKIVKELELIALSKFILDSILSNHYQSISKDKIKTCFQPTFRRYPQENNIFLAIVFGYLLKSLKLLSQLKLPEIGVKSFH